MLKLAGVVLLLVGSMSVGLAAVRRLDGRAAALRALTDALEVMECELDFRIPTMEELILETAQRAKAPASRFLNTCARRIAEEQGRPLFDLWMQSAFDELPELRPGDLDALFALGGILGRYDAEGQQNAIATTRVRLLNCLSEALEERRRKGKIYATLSITAGMFVVILLI